MNHEEKIETARNIVKRAEADGRKLTTEERETIDRLTEEARQERVGVVYSGDDVRTATSRDARHGEALPADARWSDLPTKPLPDGIKPSEISLGRTLRGIATGNWNGAEAEQRATQKVGTDNLGGYSVPSPLAANVLDYVGAESVVMKAGARRYSVEGDSLTTAKVITEPTCYWRAEDASITESSGTLGSVVLTPKVVACIVRASVELVEDAVDGGAWIERMIVNALAREIDYVALQGSGSGAEPEGILTDSSINSVEIAANGGPATWEKMSEAYHAVLADNFNPNALILHSRDWGNLDVQIIASGTQFLSPPQSAGNYKKFVSNNLSLTQTQGTSSGICSSGVIGDFGQLAIGAKLDGIRVEAFRSESTAVSQLQVVFRAYARVDVAAMHSEAFCGIIGMTAS